MQPVDTSEKLLWKEKGGARMYIDFLLGKYVIKHGKITASHKKQTSQVNDFNAFLCME